jgi:hypothetical protein
MKKFLLGLVFASTLLASCGGSLTELTSLLKDTLTYAQARVKVLSSQKTEDSLGRIKKALEVDPVTEYYLRKYESIDVNYAIKTTSGEDNETFEVRGEVLLAAIEANQVSITSSMPVIKYLFISTTQLEIIENLNDEWENSDEFLISPFLNKYRYATTTNHFGFEIKDFSSTGSGLVTTETSNEFSYSKEDNRLEKWQFQFWNKDETTGGTNTIYKTVSVDFVWNLKAD